MHRRMNNRDRNAGCLLIFLYLVSAGLSSAIASPLVETTRTNVIWEAFPFSAVEYFSPSSISAPTFNFVIGNQNAVVGNTVTFWGPQWSTHNSLTGGPAPSGFKGYASSGTPNPIACGGSWTSTGGNSSSPPAYLPEY